MPVPSAAMTLDNLVLRVARKLAVAKYRADGTPCLPVSDPFNLGECIEKVRQGWQLFVDSAPLEGWRWMKRPAEVTFSPTGAGTDNIDKDPARYMLPVDFGGEAVGKIMYAKATGHSAQIEWVDEAMIRALRATVIHIGYPQVAAIRPYQPTQTVIGPGRRWEIIFDPQPGAIAKVEFPYLIHFDGVSLYGGTAEEADDESITASVLTTRFPKDDDLKGWVCEIVNGTGQGSYAVITEYDGTTGEIVVAGWLTPDGAAEGADPEEGSEFVVKPVHPYYHPAGFAYDGVLEAACLAACEIYGGDQVFDTHHTDLFFKVKLPQAHAINRRMVPRRLGKMTDGPRHPRGRTWADVTTEHDA